MWKVLAIIAYIILLWGVIKYFFSKRVLKEESEQLRVKYDKYGPFYSLDWDKEQCCGNRSRKL